jgi:hypothetical protein
MTGKLKRDIFKFQDGRQIEVDQLPAGLTFDVLLVRDGSICPVF